MNPYYQDNHVTLYCGDALEGMRQLDAESVQCVVTSPPYWGLRKYAGNQDITWGGDPECEHEWCMTAPAGYRSCDTKPGRLQSLGSQNRNTFTSNVCAICGAWRGPYGLEPTPQRYVEHTIAFLREIRRVLRKDGVAFWVIGDSYASGKGTCFNPGGGSKSLNGHANLKAQGVYPLNRGNKSTLNECGLKPKDLCLIPQRVALAAQEDGWCVRCDIIWHKPNPMIESVKDRPTKSHEHILMLTKSARYYWDAKVVATQCKDPTDDLRRLKQASQKRRTKGTQAPDGSSYLETWSVREPKLRPAANIRSVWTFPVVKYRGAHGKHFATFPERLPELCILAASREGDIILDPFAGSGTTLWVAKKMGRRAVGIEMSEDYCATAADRCRRLAMELA